MLRLPLLLLAVALLAASCVLPSGDLEGTPVPDPEEEASRLPAGAALDDGAGLDLFEPPEAPMCLGSMYGDALAIDPDAPDYSDDDWSREQVEALFAEARSSNTDAYRAYAAARDFPELLECGFCACGCNATIGHLSAADCFKDFHGFFCGYCQRIALRTAELVDLGLTDDEVRDKLLDEFPKP